MVEIVPGLRPGLCSVTLRALAPAEVIDVSVGAGIEAVEWGADVHVPPQDEAYAAEVGRATRDAGLAVASYGSYLRLGVPPKPGAATPEQVVAAAVALGAPRIRVWAGDTGSVRADVRTRAATVDATRELAELAAVAGVVLALEFHGGTLADDAAATLRLLDEVGHPAVGTYWQPPVGLADDGALSELERVAGHLLGVHTFSWWPRNERLPLAARGDLWRGVLTRLRGRDLDVLLEFVAGDAPAQLREDVVTLRRLLGEVGSTGAG